MILSDRFSKLVSHRLFLSLLFLLSLSFNQTTAQNLSWVKQFGGPNSDEGRSIAIDKQGNVLTTGVFEGTADFDPGDGISDLISTAASNDVFINKLDANGNLLW